MNSETFEQLRNKVNDIVKLGMIGEDSKDTYQQTLAHLMNEAERKAARCRQIMSECDLRKRQAEAEMHAYSQMQSFIYAVVNGMVQLAEKEKEELKIENSNEASEIVESPKQNKKKRVYKKKTK